MKSKLFITIFLFAASVKSVFAQEGETVGGGTSASGVSVSLQNPLKNGGVSDIPTLIEKILDIALTIGVPIIALAIIYAGFKFIAAQGNKDKLQEAKQTILYVFIGAGILLAAYAIAGAIVSTVAEIRG